MVRDNVHLMRSYQTVKDSIVTVKKFDEPTGTLRFSTGFIVHSDENHSLVCVNKHVITDGENVSVFFMDGTSQVASVFLADTLWKVAVLKVPNTSGSRPVVNFSMREAKREEEIWLLTELEQGSGLNIAPCEVSGPSCFSKDVNGNPVEGTKQIFLMTCAAVSQDPKEGGSKEYTNQIIGSPVFNCDGLVVGIIDCLDDDHDAYDLKYTRHSYYLVDEFERSLQEKDNNISLARWRKHFTGHSTYERKKKKARNVPGGEAGSSSAGPAAK